MERLVLGTAQLGMPYGIANHTGMPDEKTTKAILHTAWQSGIREIDTAQAYGDSERVIGNALMLLGISNDIRIVSKFHPRLNHLNRDELSRALERTLDILGVRSLHAVMLHRESYLALWDQGLDDILAGFVDSGLIRHIGVSVYSPDKAVQALQTRGISFVQIPSNILDRRFERVGIFHLAQENGKQVYVRSVFLQGLLTLSMGEIPERMKWAGDVLQQLDAISKMTGIPRKDMALSYVKQAYPGAKIVIGVETPQQLKENLALWRKAPLAALVGRIQDAFYDVDERILNPGAWAC